MLRNNHCFLVVLMYWECIFKEFLSFRDLCQNVCERSDIIHELLQNNLSGEGWVRADET